MNIRRAFGRLFQFVAKLFRRKGSQKPAFTAPGLSNYIRPMRHARRPGQKMPAGTKSRAWGPDVPNVKPVGAMAAYLELRRVRFVTKHGWERGNWFFAQYMGRKAS